MRSRVPLLALLFAVSSLAFPFAAHAAIPFFGPIIPDSVNQCAASWGMLITVINNIISFLITLAIVFVAPIRIAYSGFLFVVNPVNAGGKEKAKGILLNTVLGIIIALSAWMIVGAVMAVLYNPGAQSGMTKLDVWTSLIGSGGIDPCINLQSSLNQTTTGAGVRGITAGGQQIGKARGPCPDGNTACSTVAIQQGAQALNMSLTSAQITTMSCIAMTESAGNPNTPNSSTGACGTFQITNRPGNWSIPALHRSPCSTSSSCNDAQCNLQTALLLYGQRGYQPWTGKNPDGTYWNPNAVACAQQYDPGARI